MANIGHFEKQKDGSFRGDIATLAIKVENVRIDAIANPVENGPSHRVYGANGAEIGAAWSRVSEAKRPYLSVKLDDPSFPEAVYGALVESQDGKYALIWSRPEATRPGATPAQADATGPKRARTAQA